MSRHVVEDSGLTIVYGWDNPTLGFYCQVWSPENKDEPVFWTDARLEIQNVEEFAQLISDWHVLTEEEKQVLLEDYANRTPLTDLQKWVRSQFRQN